MFTNFEIMHIKPVIHFFFENQNITLKNRVKLKGFIQTLLKKEKRQLDTLNYIFCSDEYLLNINKSYLNHNYYTDIITFDLSDNYTKAADIYISIDRIRENAKKQEVFLNTELHRVIFHGVLHLAGYKDKSKADKEQMRKKEDKYLSLYFK